MLDTWQRLLLLEGDCVPNSVELSTGALGSAAALADRIKFLMSEGIDFPPDVRAGILRTGQLVEIDYTPAKGPNKGRPQKTVHFNEDRAIDAACRVCQGRQPFGSKRNEQQTRKAA
jgi:hypothetical protein